MGVLRNKMIVVLIATSILSSGIFIGCGVEQDNGWEVETSREFQDVEVGETIEGTFLCGLTSANKLRCWGPSSNLGGGVRMTSRVQNIADFILAGDDLCVRNPEGDVYCEELNSSSGRVDLEVENASSVYRVNGSTICYISRENDQATCVYDSSRQYSMGRQVTFSDKIVCGVGNPDHIGRMDDKGQAKRLNWENERRPSLDCGDFCVKCVERTRDLMLGNGFIWDADTTKLTSAANTVCRVGSDNRMNCLVVEMGFNQFQGSGPDNKELTSREKVGLVTPTVGDLRLGSTFHSTEFDEVERMKSGGAGVCLKPMDSGYRCWGLQGNKYKHVNHSNLKRISVGSNKICGVTQDQRIHCFGQFSQPTIPQQFIAGNRK
jgi:hypothetical protein